MTTTDATPPPIDSIASGAPRATVSLRARTDEVFVVVAFMIAIFGDVLAFNQLATQSPIDANLQLLLFTVGIAGLVEGVRRAVFGGDRTARLVGVGVIVIAALALRAWSDHWSTEFQGLIVIVAAVVLGLLASSLLWRNRHDDGSEGAQFAGLLALGQAIIAVWFGVLAITSLGA